MINYKPNPTEHFAMGSFLKRSDDDVAKHESNPDDEDSTGKHILTQLYYAIDDVPPWYLCLFLGFQHYLTMFGGNLAFCLIVIPKLCIADDHAAQGYIMSTSFFVGGFATVLQASLGTRLPIIQGNAFAFMVPVIAILNQPRLKCQEKNINSSSLFNFDNRTKFNDGDEAWLIRMREIQGAVILASIVEFLIGITGLVGFLMRFVSPLIIAPVVCLVTLSLFSEATSTASSNWPIAITTIILLVIFSQYCSKITVPFYYCSIQSWKISWKKFRIPLFQLFPVLLTLITAWGLCAILTATDSVASESPIRTDSNWNMVHNSLWFRVPYPGQWGWPTVSVSAVLGVLSGVIASILESIGDYHACGKLVGYPNVPSHAINRGIAIEGLASVVGGIFGSGSGVTSYTENIASIGITKVASRRVVVWAGVFMILFGTMGKVGNFFMTMPKPILGGLFCVMFSMVAGVGLSSLQYVNLNSTRNLFILGSSLFMGLSIPQWVKSSPEQVIQTGNDIADQIIIVLLSTGLFVAAFVGIILDNTIPGSKEDRGISNWRKETIQGRSSYLEDRCYSFPFASSWINKYNWLRFLPISPSYQAPS